MSSTHLPETAFMLADADLAARAIAAVESQKALNDRAYALAASLGPTIQVRFMTSPFDSHFTRTILRSLTVPEGLPEGWVYIMNRKAVEPARKGPGMVEARRALLDIQPTSDQPRQILKESGLPDSTEDDLGDGRIRNFPYAWFVHDGAVFAKFHSGTRRDPVRGAWKEIAVSAWHKAREDREVAEVLASRAA